jgi:hypothetical protein
MPKFEPPPPPPRQQTSPSTSGPPPSQAPQTRSVVAPQPRSSAPPSDAYEATLFETAKPIFPQSVSPTVPPKVELPESSGVWDRHPAADELPDDLSAGDPFRDDPLPTGGDNLFPAEDNILPTNDNLFPAEDNILPTGDDLFPTPDNLLPTVEEPPLKESRYDDQTTNSQTAIDETPTSSRRINLAELTARVEGFNMALRGLEAELIEQQQSLAPETLAQLTKSLDRLAEEREFLSLYVDALKPAEREAVPKLREINRGLLVAAKKSAN